MTADIGAINLQRCNNCQHHMTVIFPRKLKEWSPFIQAQHNQQIESVCNKGDFISLKHEWFFRISNILFSTRYQSFLSVVLTVPIFVSFS